MIRSQYMNLLFLLFVQMIINAGKQTIYTYQSLQFNSEYRIIILPPSFITLLKVYSLLLTS